MGQDATTERTSCHRSDEKYGLTHILVINTGSSSHKCTLFSPKMIWKGHLQWDEGFSNVHLTIENKDGKKDTPQIFAQNPKEGLRKLLQFLWEGQQAVIASPNEIPVVGHRVVHGGEQFRKTVEVTPEVKEAIHSLSYLAPLHNQPNLEGIETAQTLFPEASHYASFDTAFHATISKAAALYPGPLAWKDKGIRRYGFHGINYQSCARRLARYFSHKAKAVICHLGAGASLCALKDGKSIDTTMGMTPLEGLMMATRSGTIDPGIFFHLAREENMKPEELEILLNEKSGLVGIAGTSDMRLLMEQAQSHHPLASLALEMYLHRLRGFIGMMIASLEGLDALVFTGGIGENSPEIRKRVCDSFAYLELKLDEKKNQETEDEKEAVSTSDSEVKIFIFKAQEEEEIARECCEIVNGGIQ